MHTVRNSQPLSEFYSRFRIREPVPKVFRFYETLVPRMTGRQYNRIFRMHRSTMTALIEFLTTNADLSPRARGVAVDKRVAVTCAYLGSQNSPHQ